MGSPETNYATGGQPEVSSTERVPADDRLVPLGPHGNQGNLHAGYLFEDADVLLGGFRQVAQLLGGGDILLPPLHLLVDGLRLLEFGEREGNLVPPRPSDLVGDADLDPRQTRQDVELGERESGEAVQPLGVPHHGSVEPAAPAWTPRRGPVLVPPVPDQLSLLVEQLRGERPSSDAGGVRFRNTDD